MTNTALDYIGALSEVYDASSCRIEKFREFPIVIERLRQLQAAYRMSPGNGHALEFGVFRGQSIRSLAHKFPKNQFHGFDSFEGLPEAWHQSHEKTYERGHFKLDALPPVPANVTLIKGFFVQTLEGWLKDNPGPVCFIHQDPDLYSAAKFTLDSLADRMVDGTVIVFDELCDWEDSGVYPNWPQGEWKALCEWLQETGFCFRILSRSFKYQAAIQVYRSAPPAINGQRIFEIANAFWESACRSEAINLLEQRASVKPSWLGGNHRLATWLDKSKDAEGVIRTVDRMMPTLAQQPEHAYATDVWRLRATGLYRMADFAAAYAEIRKFVVAKPEHVGGLVLAAKCAAACLDYSNAQSLWHRATALTGNRTYRKEEKSVERLIPVATELRTMKFSSLMIHHLIHERSFETVLDVGSGAGEQAQALRNAGKIVTELDYGKSKYFVLNPDEGGAVIGDFVELEIEQQFDCMIASHVLEHQLNVGAFLQKSHEVVREGGLIAISVPPAKSQIVGGHVTLWNAGLLLYNLVLAGFDCSEPWIRTYGYNISVVIKKKTIKTNNLQFDSGDVDRLRSYLPEGFGEGFNGDIDQFG